MNKNINISNYEEFLIDFLDGILDEATHAQVLLFLENNPDIAEEFDGIEDVVVDECIGSINFKDELKIKLEPKILVNTENYEHYFIAYHQGDLSNDEIIQIDDFLSENPQLQKDFDLFKVVSSVKSTQVSFEDKDLLKVVEFADGEFILKSEFETICIDYFEGNLASDTTYTLLDTVANNEELANVFNLYHNTKLKADNSIVFDEKSKLYRRRIFAIVPAIRYINSIAATVILLLMFNVYNFNLEGLDIENNISNPENIETPIIKLPLESNIIETPNNDLSNVVSTIDSKTTVVKYVNISKFKKTRSPNNSVFFVEPRDLIAGVNTNNFELGAPKLIRAVAAAVDTSYFIINAPVLADNNTVEEISPEEIIDDNGDSKFKKKIKRIFNREKEYLANREPKDAMKKIASFAVKSYNIMTESDGRFAKN